MLGHIGIDNLSKIPDIWLQHFKNLLQVAQKTFSTPEFNAAVIIVEGTSLTEHQQQQIIAQLESMNRLINLRKHS